MNDLAACVPGPQHAEVLGWQVPRFFQALIEGVEEVLHRSQTGWRYGLYGYIQLNLRYLL